MSERRQKFFVHVSTLLQKCLHLFVSVSLQFFVCVSTLLQKCLHIFVRVSTLLQCLHFFVSVSTLLQKHVYTFLSMCLLYYYYPYCE